MVILLFAFKLFICRQQMGHADIVKLLMIIKKNLGEKRTRTVVGWGDVITDQGPEGNMLWSWHSPNTYKLWELLEIRLLLKCFKGRIMHELQCDQIIIK